MAVAGHGDYDKVNHPYIDFDKEIVQGGNKIGVRNTLIAGLSGSGPADSVF